MLCHPLAPDLRELPFDVGSPLSPVAHTEREEPDSSDDISFGLAEVISQLAYIDFTGLMAGQAS